MLRHQGSGSEELSHTEDSLTTHVSAARFRGPTVDFQSYRASQLYILATHFWDARPSSQDTKVKDFLQSELQKFSYSLWRDFIYCQAIETNVSVVFCTKLNAEKLKYKTTV